MRWVKKLSRVKAIGSTSPSALTTKGDGGGGQSADGEREPDDRQKSADENKPGERDLFCRDTSERQKQSKAPGAGTGLSAGLTIQGEDQLAPEQQIAILQQKLKEMESAFGFMGTGHPDYERTRTQVEQLRAMVKALTG